MDEKINEYASEKDIKIGQIQKKISAEIDKLLLREDLTSEEIRTLQYHNFDLVSEKRQSKMQDVATDVSAIFNNIMCGPV